MYYINYVYESTLRVKRIVISTKTCSHLRLSFKRAVQCSLNKIIIQSFNVHFRKIKYRVLLF